MTVGPEFGPCLLTNPYISTSDVKIDSRIKQVLDNFHFQGKSGFIQFWECGASGDPEDNGCYLLLTNHLRVSNIRDNRLEDYRDECLNDNYRFVGRQKNVGNWFAGRATQTKVADYQFDGEALGMGQLVVPVYHPGVVLKLAGILEIVTDQRNETYTADFNRIQSSLMKVNLTSTYLGKTIKVQHKKELVKFTLPFLAKRADLQEQVIMRFIELKNKAFSIAYTDTNNIHHSIKSDHDLQSRIADSISNRVTLIRMFVEDMMTVGQEFGPCFLSNTYISTSDVKTDSRIKRVLDNFDFQGKSGFIQFWECGPSGDPEGNGCYLLLTDHLRESDIRDNRLEAYRWTCLNDNYRFVGREKSVGNWYPGRAVQTQVADYQYDDEASGMGQLVIPVYHPGAVRKLAGILDIVTAQHNETYAADFIRIQSSLMRVNSTSTYLGKAIKVQHKRELVKFTLPFIANSADLQKQVIMRFNELENKAFSIAYTDINSIRHSIKSDHDLQSCIADMISNRTTLIRMFVEDVIG